MLMREIKKLDHIGDVERVRLKLEWFKAWGTLLAISVPLSIGVGTIIFNVMLAHTRERVDFELKATEIVMNASSPAAATNKAAVLVELFPDKLPKQFSKTFERLYGNNTTQPLH